MSSKHTDATAFEVLQRGACGAAVRYEVHVPIADRRYDEHLDQLRKEGLIDD